MSKGLEALKYLKENKRMHWLDNDNSNKCLDTIEKDLEVLEIIKKRCAPLLKSYMLDQLSKDEYKLVKEFLDEK